MARLPEGALMQRAATGLAHAVADVLPRVYGARVLLLVGSGDNGGDALFAGAALARRGVAVEALLLSPGRAHAGGVAALREAGGDLLTDAARVRHPDLVVDGIVGIGGSAGLREDAVAALDAVAACPVVAVDTPSGVGVDDGTLGGAHVSAAVTVTFGTHKVASPRRAGGGRLRGGAPRRPGPRPPARRAHVAAGRRRRRAPAATGERRAQVQPRRGRGAHGLGAVPGRGRPRRRRCLLGSCRHGALRRSGRRRRPRSASRGRRGGGAGAGLGRRLGRGLRRRRRTGRRASPRECPLVPGRRRARAAGRARGARSGCPPC